MPNQSLKDSNQEVEGIKFESREQPIYEQRM